MESQITTIPTPTVDSRTSLDKQFCFPFDLFPILCPIFYYITYKKEEKIPFLSQHLPRHSHKTKSKTPPKRRKRKELYTQTSANMVQFTVFKGSKDGKITQSTTTKDIKDDEVLIKVTHSGVCGTDEHERTMGIGLGHEGAGIVEVNSA
jgi:hypothetical protein